GHWWWAVAPFGYPHPSAWKAPGYPAWVGLWYSLLGPAPVRLELVQALLAPLTVLFTWLLARRISGPPAPILAAAVTAAFPFVWEFFGVLYPEALAIPLTLAALLAFLGRPPTRGRILAFGVLLGINLLVRPTSFFLLAGALAAWVAAAGWRRGIAATVAAGAIALLVVSPWTIRNLVTDRVGFVPISVQDAAAYGTFNPVSADDPSLPYAWRPNALVSLSEFRNAKSEAALRSDLQRRAIAFIRAHPASVIEAFYWNGIRRFWDLQSPARVQGRARATTIAGLAIYWCLLPLAAVGLWRLRRRREIAYPVLAMAAVASLAFTIVASTRYRAPLEPVIAILACSLAARARTPAIARGPRGRDPSLLVSAVRSRSRRSAPTGTGRRAPGGQIAAQPAGEVLGLGRELVAELALEAWIEGRVLALADERPVERDRGPPREEAPEPPGIHRVEQPARPVLAVRVRAGELDRPARRLEAEERGDARERSRRVRDQLLEQQHAQPVPAEVGAHALELAQVAAVLQVTEARAALGLAPALLGEGIRNAEPLVAEASLVPVVGLGAAHGVPEDGDQPRLRHGSGHPLDSLRVGEVAGALLPHERALGKRGEPRSVPPQVVIAVLAAEEVELAQALDPRVGAQQVLERGGAGLLGSDDQEIGQSHALAARMRGGPSGLGGARIICSARPPSPTWNLPWPEPLPRTPAPSASER